MRSNTPISPQQLVTTLRFAGWIKLLRLPGKNLLVADPEFITELKNQVSNLDCVFSTPTQAQADITKSRANRIIVLTRKREFKLVKKLRQKFPNRRILSTLYDLCPIDFMNPKLEANSDHKNIDIDKKARSLKLLVASKMSDVEYIEKINRVNNQGVSIQDPMGYTALSLMRYVDHFQPVRYIANFLTSHSSHNQIILRVNFDLIDFLERCTALKWRYIKRFIEHAELKIIYFQRRDILIQAALSSMLDRHPAQSLWHLPPNVLHKFSNNNIVGFIVACDALARQLSQATQVERKLRHLPSVHIVILEELLSSPQEVLKSFYGFLDIDFASQINVPPYQELYQSVPGLIDRIAEFKREYIDRLGLHVNDAGSLITETEKLLLAPGVYKG